MLDAVIEQGCRGGGSVRCVSLAYDQGEFISLIGSESRRFSRHDLRFVVEARVNIPRRRGTRLFRQSPEKRLPFE